MTPTIEVICDKSFANGEAHWCEIDATQGVTRIRAAIEAFLRESPCPDHTVICPECQGEGPCDHCGGLGEVPSATSWSIAGASGFEGWVPRAKEPLQAIADVAAAIVRYEKVQGNIVGAWLAFGGLIEELDQSFQGCFESELAYAKHFATTSGMMEGWPEAAVRGFDASHFASKLFREGYYFDAGTGAVFGPGGPSAMGPMAAPSPAPAASSVTAAPVRAMRMR